MLVMVAMVRTGGGNTAIMMSGDGRCVVMMVIR